MPSITDATNNNDATDAGASTSKRKSTRTTPSKRTAPRTAKHSSPNNALNFPLANANNPADDDNTNQDTAAAAGTGLADTDPSETAAKLAALAQTLLGHTAALDAKITSLTAIEATLNDKITKLTEVTHKIDIKTAGLEDQVEDLRYDRARVEKVIETLNTAVSTAEKSVPNIAANDQNVMEHFNLAREHVEAAEDEIHNLWTLHEASNSSPDSTPDWTITLADHIDEAHNNLFLAFELK